MPTSRTASFPAGFLWGASTAAYQIEGAAAEDGRGPSIWDTFSREPGRVLHGDTGDVAADHYHRLDEDLDLLTTLGVQVYRFSVSWSRVIPAGRGAVNERGLAFYDRLIDGLIARGIRPVPTLYHWDLPQALQDEGGWENRDTVEAFGAYAELLGRRYGDRVDMWTTINEPWVLTYIGNAFGVHAPGKSDHAAAARVHHHILLAHAVGAEKLRATVPGASIGLALNMSHIYPGLSTPESIAAAELAQDQLVDSFLDPLTGQGYPAGIIGYSQRWADGQGLVLPGDLDRIAGTLDWLSINEYHPRWVVAEADLPAIREKGWHGEPGSPFAVGQPFVDVYPPNGRYTLMGWIIDPQGFTDLLVSVGQRHPGLPLYVSENGAAFPDYRGTDGVVRDDERVDYLDSHLRAAAEAIRQGVDLRGYFVWSLLDNYEWAEGFSKRFGLVYVDYPTGERTPKQSFDWYRTVVARNAVG